MNENCELLERSKDSETYLLQIASQYKEYFTSAKKWDDFSKENDLPTSRQYIYHFGTWNKAKQAANLPLSKREEYTHRKYTKDDLIKIIKEHREHFTSKEEWNEYAKEHKLPYYETFWYYDIYWDEILEIAGIPTYNCTPEELLTIAEEHQDYFVTRKNWDEYAEQQDLPNSYQYIKKFGNWSEVKNKILKLEDKDLLEIARKHDLTKYSRRKWDEYAKKLNLPTSSLYIERFGGWYRLKAMLQ